MPHRLFLCLCFVLGGSLLAGPKPIELWPEGVPGLRADAAPERIENNRIVGIHFPSLLRFDPEPGKANGAAVVFCPGGGYVRISVPEDGGEEVKHLNRLGVTVFVLKYRLKEYGHPAPLQDVLRAMRQVRSHAGAWGLRADCIGVMGGSAGGHLALSAATLWDDPAGVTGCDLDKISARPDFAILIYPVVTMNDPYVHKGSRTALLGSEPKPALRDALSLETRVRSDMPKVFIVATMADRSVPVENSLLLYQALRKAGVPSELHAFSAGSHGNSLDPQYGPTARWLDRCGEWLQFIGVTP